ncbi:DNA repair protein rhp54 [Hordeum vulgare]|nr:DNA repair protein rhp54 [Hordeum vulgare]
MPTPIDLNATPTTDVSSSGGSRKRVGEMSVDMLSGARNLFDEMSADIDDERSNRFMPSIIFGGDATTVGGAAVAAAGDDPEETQSQDN